ncbi:MAG: 50S ribosomal protein L25 [Candidatus Marinimicrobia bacterium]|nr:50S ribosomal protein L25 [Candidatus Neomarinimicrobiota bacterium]
MEIYKLKTEKRENLKKSHTNQLRKADLIPGVYYFHKEEPIALTVEKAELLTAIRKNTHIFQLDMGKKKLQSVIKKIQWHPVTDEPIHVDFQGVSENEPVEVSIKVETQGQAKGVREQGGLLNQVVWHLDVKCSLKDIPESIVVDVANLGMGESLAVKDLKIDKVEILDNPEKSIVSVIAPKGASTKVEGDGEEEAAE